MQESSLWFVNKIGLFIAILFVLCFRSMDLSFPQLNTILNLNAPFGLNWMKLFVIWLLIKYNQDSTTLSNCCRYPNAQKASLFCQTCNRFLVQCHFIFRRENRLVDMSSLVAYDDSGSEDDCHNPSEEDGDTASAQSRTSESTSHSSDRSTLGGISTLEYHGHNSEVPQPRPWPQGLENHLIVASAPPNLAVAGGKISPMWTSPQRPQMLSDKLNPAKRPCAVPSGIRPYIPKRQRLATSGETLSSKSQVEHNPGCQTRVSHVLLEVSERVKPYLDNRPGTAGIPRRLLMSLGGHQGPVNTVQWCPVPQHSHLLLSASMDKTFKVHISTTT